MAQMVIYDISDDKVRTRVSKELVKAGYTRIQYSVFVGKKRKSQFIQLWDTLKNLCGNKADQKLYAWDIPDDLLGNYYSNQEEVNWDLILGKLHTLII